MVLNLVSSIPESSGIRVLTTLPLIIAGSALQKPQGRASTHESAGPARLRVENEILSVYRSDHMLSHWPSLVQMKLKSLHEQIGLGAIRRAIQILDAVWLRADLSVSATDSASKASFIHWMDVMVEERLESVFG